MAYISGVLDSNSQCGPYTFSLREAMGIVASWLAADPARQNLPGSEVVVSSGRGARAKYKVRALPIASELRPLVALLRELPLPDYGFEPRSDE